MVNFQLDMKSFLTEYWQKKPLVIRQALPNFINPISPDELAGLALEEEVESRLVFETPGVAPFWQLKPGPFVDADFATLPKTHWTLLVQGVDRLVPEVSRLFDHFAFIPSWRIDDVMISFAVQQGSVGPHYDNYDVFLFQAMGRRKWSLTTQHCQPDNYLNDVPLRIMDQFEVEEEYWLEPGDMLYLPPHVGHYGVSESDECMTYSFGYRSYQAQEMWDSLGDYLSEHSQLPRLYHDPNWVDNQSTALIPPQAVLNAKQLMQQLLDDEALLQRWFGCFVTSLDQQAEHLLPPLLEEEEAGELADFIAELTESQGLAREATCRFAYLQDALQLFINGTAWNTDNVSPELILYLANHRWLPIQDLLPFLSQKSNQQFLYELWILQWLQIASS